MKRPFMFITIPLILGIIISYHIIISSIVYGVALLLLIIGVIICIGRGKGFILSIFLLMLVLGCLITNLHLGKSSLLQFKNDEIQVEGIIKEVLTEEEDYSKYLITVERVKSSSRQANIKEKLVLKVSGNTTLDVGDKVLVIGVLNEPQENSNPGLFDYKLYLQTQNIFVTMYTKDYNINVIAKDQLTVPEKTAKDFKIKIEKLFDDNLMEEHSSLMKSMLLGDSSYLDEITEKRFRDVGLAHVLAVSGLHIGIISLFLIYALSFIGLNRRLAILFTILIIWFYGYMIGYPASVLRASIMFSFLMLANLIYRRYDAVNLIFFAGFILLIFNPLRIFSVGFQLSFSATISLVLFTNRIHEVVFKGKGKIGQALSPLIAVQIGIIPIMAYHFNNLSTISIIANLLLVPIISVALILGFVMIVFSLVSIGFFHIILYLLSSLLGMLLYIVSFLVYIMHQIPYVNISLPSPWIIEIILFYLVIFILLKIINIGLFADIFKYRVSKAVLIYLYILIIFTGFGLFFHTKVITIDFIDVGQGDCALIRVNNKNFLVDSGGTPNSDYDIGKNVILPYLKKQGVRKLDGVFISHFHVDHCEGVKSFFGNIKLDNIFIGYKNNSNELYNELFELSRKYKMRLTILNKGDRIMIGNNVAVRILFPTKETMFTENENNMSLVMLIEANDRKILFTGDIEKEVEEEIVNSEIKEDIDVLKVPHHGSNTSSMNNFIDFFRPEYAIIQVGRNSFGHPDEEVINRYMSRGIEVFRNDNDGMVRVIIDSNTIEAYSYLPSRRLLKNILLKYNLQLMIVLIFLIISTYFTKKFICILMKKFGGDENEL